jgi:hypothetical protein
MYDDSYKIKVYDILVPVGIFDLIVIQSFVHIYETWIYTLKVIIIKK